MIPNCIFWKLNNYQIRKLAFSLHIKFFLEITDYNWACKEVSQCTLFGTRVQCKGQGSTNCVCDENSRRLIEDNICWIAKGETIKNWTTLRVIFHVLLKKVRAKNALTWRTAAQQAVTI